MKEQKKTERNKERKKQKKKYRKNQERITERKKESKTYASSAKLRMCGPYVPPLCACALVYTKLTDMLLLSNVFVFACSVFKDFY
jgi:hypothetical protein